MLEVPGNTVPALFADLIPVACKVFDRGRSCPVHPARGGTDEESGKAPRTRLIDFAARRTIGVGEIRNQRGDEIGGESIVLRRPPAMRVNAAGAIAFMPIPWGRPATARLRISPMIPALAVA